VQLAFVFLLDAELADHLGAAVVGEVLLGPLFHHGEFGPVDAPDVADQMTGEFAVWIVAKQPGLDLDTGKAIALGREARHFGVAEFGADRQGLETARIFEQALETTPVTRLDFDHLGELIDRRFERVGELRACDFERVGRIVVGQHDAVSVDDQAAIGHDRHHRDAVVLGPGGEVFVYHHLQVDQSGSQQSEAEEHEDGGHDQAGAIALQLLFDIAQLDHQ
jgi:hypothetical protein